MKSTYPTKLLWVDLEMTGLTPDKDVILEVAAIITDFDFRPLATYEQRIVQDKDTVAARMDANPWWRDYPGNRKQFYEEPGRWEGTCRRPERPRGAREGALRRRPGCILAGNSIYNDRLFIKQWLPKLEALLHYRMLDVSSFKILMQGKYAHEFKKQSLHRALDDIQASIAELQEYLEHLGAPD
jgi:oligoribonuclease